MRKKALITGASRGIGEAIAKELARQGFDLTLTCLNSLDRLKELAGGLEKKYGVSCHIFQGDMGDPEAVDRLFDGLNRLDVLINNAGISHIGLLSDMSVSQWRRVMSTNLDSCFYTCRRAIPLMVHAKQGRIINISSVWGQTGASMEAAYSASKGGVNSLTKALAKELAPSNIQVNAIACGAIDTEMNQWMDEDDLIALVDEIPSGRLGRAEEVADLAYHLGYKESYLTGQIIGLDGGWI